MFSEVSGFCRLHRMLRAQVRGGCSKGVSRRSPRRALCSGAPGEAVPGSSPQDAARTEPRSPAALLVLEKPPREGAGEHIPSLPGAGPEGAGRGQPRAAAVAVSPGSAQVQPAPVLLSQLQHCHLGSARRNHGTVWTGRDWPVPTPYHRQASSGCSEQGLS